MVFRPIFESGLTAFNRTLLELKSSLSMYIWRALMPSIAPYWN